jgi:hypothetical protein
MQRGLAWTHFFLTRCARTGGQRQRHSAARRVSPPTWTRSRATLCSGEAVQGTRGEAGVRHFNLGRTSMRGTRRGRSHHFFQRREAEQGQRKHREATPRPGLGCRTQGSKVMLCPGPASCSAPAGLGQRRSRRCRVPLLIPPVRQG